MYSVLSKCSLFTIPGPPIAGIQDMIMDGETDMSTTTNGVNIIAITMGITIADVSTTEDLGDY